MTVETIAKRLEEFIIGELLLDNSIEIGLDDHLLVDGHIDSIGAIRLVDFIERAWAIQVPPLDVTVDNFGTIELIAGYIVDHAGNKSSPG